MISLDKIDKKILTILQQNSKTNIKEIGLKIKNTGNTIIRTIFEHLKYDIIKLDCVMIADLTKKDIPRGHWKHLTELEISKLKML